MAIFATVVYIAFNLFGAVTGFILLVQNDWQPLRMKDSRPILGNLTTLILISALYLWVIVAVHPADWVVWTMAVGIFMNAVHLSRIALVNRGVWSIAPMPLIIGLVYSTVVTVGLLQAVGHA